jgi:glycosyltransferase involved in cell wall biosynthesis
MDLEQRIICFLERRCIRRASIVYAPSRLLADYARGRLGVKAKVVRPPAYIEVAPYANPLGLPERYFIHFGTIGRRKGSDVIAEALPLVWQQAPDFAMVWAGKLNGATSFDEYRRKWGRHASHVVWTGPAEKPLLYGMLRRADAAVLPSRVDNLPNTVIESLLFRVPVIGTRGTSIEELVEPGRSGELVPTGDPTALASVMISAWRRSVPWANGGFQPPAVLAEMDPKSAASAVVRLVRTLL